MSKSAYADPRAAVGIRHIEGDLSGCAESPETPATPARLSRFRVAHSPRGRIIGAGHVATDPDAADTPFA